MQTSPNTLQSFSVKATLKEGWHLVRGAKLSVLATLVPMLLVALTAFLVLTRLQLNTASNSYIALLYSLISPLIDAILLSGFLAGLAMIGLKRARHEAVRLSEGLQYFKKLPKLAGIAYLETLFIFLMNNIFIFATAMLLVRLPIHNSHIMAMITLVVALSIVALDKQYSVLLAIGRSVKIISRHYWKVLAVIVILAFANLIGACLAGIGLFWTIPFSYNSIGVLYRELADKGV
ncbi:MAG: putative rane protein [Gammaproteobacteria bacterium]|nr:putative rane protein [Gammaproteobacteria bacterium]